MIGGFSKQLGVAKTNNSKQRQMTLKDMVFQNLNPGSENPTTASAETSKLAQSHKMPLKSPETPSGGSEPEDENSEAVVIFSKGIRKFSRNKAETEGEDGTGNDSTEKLNNVKETGKATEPNKSPVVRRRAVLPAQQLEPVLAEQPATKKR